MEGTPPAFVFVSRAHTHTYTSARAQADTEGGREFAPHLYRYNYPPLVRQSVMEPSAGDRPPRALR